MLPIRWSEEDELPGIAVDNVMTDACRATMSVYDDICRYGRVWKLITPTSVVFMQVADVNLVEGVNNF